MALVMFQYFSITSSKLMMPAYIGTNKRWSKSTLAAGLTSNAKGTFRLYLMCLQSQGDKSCCKLKLNSSSRSTYASVFNILKLRYQHNHAMLSRESEAIVRSECRSRRSRILTSSKSQRYLRLFEQFLSSEALVPVLVPEAFKRIKGC